MRGLRVIAIIAVMLVVGVGFSTVGYSHWIAVHCHEGDWYSQQFEDRAKEAVESRAGTDALRPILLPARILSARVAGPTLIVGVSASDWFTLRWHRLNIEPGPADELRRAWRSVFMRYFAKPDAVNVVAIVDPLQHEIELSQPACASF